MHKKKFREYLSLSGHKSSKKRDEILDEVLNIEGHFDIEYLYTRLKQKGSKISRASLYRTIPLLVESGFIEEVERVDRHAHYEKVSQKRHHDHMICLTCYKVIEFYSEDLEDIQNKVAHEYDFTAIRHSLELYGYCSECANKSLKNS